MSGGAGASLTPFSIPVAADWIDYNGHLNEGYFVVAFALATDSVLDQFGIGERYARTTTSSVYTVESHIRYLDQARLSDVLTVRSTVLGVDAKRLRLWHEMSVDGTPRATQEVMLLHVDAQRGSTVAFAPEVVNDIRACLGSVPDAAGRGIRSIGTA